MNAPIIGANPDRALLYRARRDHGDGCIIFRRCDIRCQAAAFRKGLNLWIIRCQISADNVPAQTAIC